MLNLMLSGAKINYLCKGSRKSLNKNTNEGASKESDPICGPYACFIYFKLFSGMLNIMSSGAKLNYLCKNSYFAIKGCVWSKIVQQQGASNVSEV